ncbi:uncharacterized protein LOC129233000 [Uloborus diversus]|uniref:uncharacterized protein LOC129233000 n=1 Tax=Uloborus diversus TaxID=327109 RepID=UPI00240A298B|nr:uncharacterized protein LOC129233000 [Uloborus diversus]
MNSGDGCGANRELPSTSKRQSEDSEKEPPRKRVEACHDVSGEMKLLRAVRCSDRCATLAISTAGPKDLGMRDEAGRTALHEAVGRRSAEVVEMMLAAWSSSHLGATHPLLEIQDNEGWTALHVAVEYGFLEVVEVLLAARTDINPRDANGRKPLVDIQNEFGKTALHKAAFGYHAEHGYLTEMVAMLLAAGANDIFRMTGAGLRFTSPLDQGRRRLQKSSAMPTIETFFGMTMDGLCCILLRNLECKLLLENFCLRGLFGKLFVRERNRLRMRRNGKELLSRRARRTWSTYGTTTE